MRVKTMFCSFTVSNKLVGWRTTAFRLFVATSVVSFYHFLFTPHSRPPDAGCGQRTQSNRRRSAARRADDDEGHHETADFEICASYSRFSSDHQKDESITGQQRKCRERAEKDGTRIDGSFEFADAAVSGTKLHREGLDAMMAAAAAGKFQRLYFYSLSRLARESVITMPMLK